MASDPSSAPGLLTEDEYHQRKLDKAAETGDPGSDVQTTPEAAADQLAAIVKPTPAIPARPETSTPPSNVPQRQQAGLQPLPTPDEEEEMEIDGQALVPLVKKMFFVADDAGEPHVSVGQYTVSMTYPDGSHVIVRFEMRPGEFGAIGRAAATPDEASARNKRFGDLKKQREERREQARNLAQDEAKSDATAHAEQKPA